MDEAFVNPTNLRWAREQQSASVDAAAKRLHISPERLASWEHGLSRPSLRQAREFAERFGIPLGYLFLTDTPGVEPLGLPDLRTITDQPVGPPSSELVDVVDDALRKQAWFREFQESEGAQPLPFVGRFSVDVDPTELADDIRRVLRLEDINSKSGSADEYLRLLSSRAEDAGVLVLRSGVVENNTKRKLSVLEFRGFAISDPIAPLIFINAQDAKVAQIFTLAHELAHIWVGASGVSNPDVLSAGEQGSTVERLTNRAAADTLMPQHDFRSVWPRSPVSETAVDGVARRFWVSAVAALRQARDLGLLRYAEFQDLYKRVSNRTFPSNSASEGGNFYSTLFVRSSRSLVSSLVTALAEGKVLHRDAARLLNVRVSTLTAIQKRLLDAGAAPFA